MGNILNHNRDIFQFDLCKEDYWDFHISLNLSGNGADGYTDKCLSVHVDTDDEECLWLDDLYSSKRYKWKDAIKNDGFVFENFGLTSVDNGKTSYDVYTITNKEFLELFTNTKFEMEKDDYRLLLSKISGNHQIYDYSSEFAFIDGMQVAKLNGGFYQGFFCANDGSEYKILPTDIGDGWTFEFMLKKEDFENDKLTLNDTHPENKGIFFYIGTRSENKWWERYKTDIEFDKCPKDAMDDEYVSSEYVDTTNINSEFLVPEEDGCYEKIVVAYENGEYFGEDYLEGEVYDTRETPFEEEYFNEKCEDCDNYVNEGYVQKDVDIDVDEDLELSNGYPISQLNIEEIKTDNKFILFDRTKEGFTTRNWEEGTEVILTQPKRQEIGNLFTLMHRSYGGYTAKTIEKLFKEKNTEYNVLSDLYRNALAFQIKDDGSIGYKYLVKDCESEEENYKIESEFTKPNIVLDKEWAIIQVVLRPVKHRNRFLPNCVSKNTASDNMRIFIYVNGKLALVSRQLPILNLKALNDMYEKQEGIPFNISLGGGTQGLAETVTLNYRKKPQYVLPLEKEFGGTFIGYVRLFNFHTCRLKFQELVSNHEFIKKKQYLFIT